MTHPALLAPEPTASRIWLNAGCALRATLNLNPSLSAEDGVLPPVVLFCNTSPPPAHAPITLLLAGWLLSAPDSFWDTSTTRAAAAWACLGLLGSGVSAPNMGCFLLVSRAGPCKPTCLACSMCSCWLHAAAAAPSDVGPPAHAAEAASWGAVGPCACAPCSLRLTSVVSVLLPRESRVMEARLWAKQG